MTWHTPPRTLLTMLSQPVGTRSIWNTGYARIKTAMGQRRWPFEHHVVWESAHGPRPDGSFIHHLNGVKSDNRIENLVLTLSNGEHHHLFHRGIKRPGVSAALKGRTLSPEHRAKMSASLMGKPKSAEHRAKLSAALKGRPLDVATRAKISATLKGHPAHPNSLANQHRDARGRWIPAPSSP